MNAILIISLISGFIAYLLIIKVKKRAVKRAYNQSLNIKYPLKTTYSSLEYLLASLINNHIEDLGHERLKLNDTISTVCQEHSLNLAKLTSIKHENAGLRKNKLKKALGITGSGEIVAKGQGTAKGMLRMWLKSPKHKATIERGHWKEFGISIEQSLLRRNYITCIFTK